MNRLKSGILSDGEIIDLCENEAMITPFETKQIKVSDYSYDNHYPRISYGPSSYGYDCRLSSQGFKIFSPVQGKEIDPKNFDDKSLIDAPLRKVKNLNVTDSIIAQYFLLPPHSYALGYTIETFKMPNNVTSIVIGKSTYSRCGCIVNCTPLEAGWEGQLVLEIYNAANLPLRVYADEGIAQCLFFAGNYKCLTSYKIEKVNIKIKVVLL